jgi:hypothetical protein
MDWYLCRIKILPNAIAEIKNNPQLEPIIIEQGGIAEELFKDSQILQIEVDGKSKMGIHRRWWSILSFIYGEQTIKHFTKENSPLPTNSVTDIKVDKKTGKVYFVTYDGIVTYQGDVGDVTSNLEMY